MSFVELVSNTEASTVYPANVCVMKPLDKVGVGLGSNNGGVSFPEALLKNVNFTYAKGLLATSRLCKMVEIIQCITSNRPYRRISEPTSIIMQFERCTTVN